MATDNLGKYIRPAICGRPCSQDRTDFLLAVKEAGYGRHMWDVPVSWVLNDKNRQGKKKSLSLPT